MNDLLERAIAAHGGLTHFQEFQTISADVSIGGALWTLKQRPPRTNVRVKVDLRQERAEFSPFGGGNQRGVFTPQHLTVETAEGAIVAGRVKFFRFSSDTATLLRRYFDAEWRKCDPRRWRLADYERAHGGNLIDLNEVPLFLSTWNAADGQELSRDVLDGGLQSCGVRC
jgi:hypothetical protein